MKSVALLTILFIIGAKSFSQEFNAGVDLGLVASQIDGDTHAGFSKAGVAFGAHINRYFNKKWAWQFGLSYKQKGSKYVDKFGNFYHAKLNYVEMPLSVRYFHYEKIDFEAGASMGYLFSAAENIDAYEFKDPNPPFNKIELSTLAGVNYRFSKKVTISLHHQYSIFPVRFYLEGYEEYLEKNQYNNVAFFTLTYMLPSWN